MSFRRVYENSPSEHKITNVGSENCDIILWKENLPDTGKTLYLTIYLFIFIILFFLLWWLNHECMVMDDYKKDKTVRYWTGHER